jgi:hypothetical protein
MGMAFMELHEFDSTFYYYNKVIPGFIDLGEMKYASMVIMDYGFAYLNMGDLKSRDQRNEGEKAIPLLDSALAIQKGLNYKYGIIITLNNLGSAYSDYITPPDYQKADYYYRETIEMLLDSNYYSFLLPATYKSLADICLEKGDASSAQEYYQLGLNAYSDFLSKTDSVDGWFPFRRIAEVNYIYGVGSELYEALYQLYRGRKDYLKALDFYVLKNQADDSLEKKNTRKQIDKILTIAAEENTNQKIQLLASESELQRNRAQLRMQWMVGLGIVILLILISVILFFQQIRLKAEQEKTLLQQRLFRSQMNPHFVFNSLGSIQCSIINEEPDKAVKYLSMFSKLMRNILDSSQEETISLKDEITTIKNYLELQKVRFPRKFDYSIDVDNDIDEEQLFLPPILAQPFIENAIEHGIKHKEGKGRIDIRCRRSNDVAMFEVEDDGIGRERARDLLLKQEESHKSLATVITRERIAALNRRSKKKITLEIIDLKDDAGKARGTLVRFGLPITPPASSA